MSHWPDEPIGLTQLRDLGSELFRDVDPLAKLVERPALDIASDGRETVLRLLVPGASRDELDIEMEGDELIISLGSYRRSVKLPDGLTGRSVDRAAFGVSIWRSCSGTPPMADTSEDAIWSLLRDRAEDDRNAPTGDVAPPRTNRESLVVVLDAALGLLSATRHLVEVTEDVVRERRDRLRPNPTVVRLETSNRSRCNVERST